MADIVERLERVVRRHVLESMPPASDGSLMQMELAKLLIEYRTWRGRFVAPQPRIVRTSSELQASSAAQDHSTALTALRQKIEAGEDLTPHLSTRILQPLENVRAPKLEHRTDRDSLLADWGVHHLHLSRRTRRGAARRGDDVLFAMFTEQTAYFIDIRAHPQYANWAAEDIFAIIVRNWPNDGLVHQMSGFSLAQQISDDDRLQLRNAGVANVMEIDGNVYIPGGFGQTTAGTPIEASRAVHALLRAFHPWREDFDAALATSPDAPTDAYWTPAIHAPRPGFEEYCGFAAATPNGATFLPVGRLC